MRRYYHPVPKRDLEGAASTTTGTKKKANVTKSSPDGTTSDLGRQRPIDMNRQGTKGKVVGGNGGHSKSRNGRQDFGRQRQSESHALSSNQPDMINAYRICFVASLDCARFLLAQGMPFSRPCQSPTSINKGNLLELIDWYKKLKKEIERAFDVSAAGNHEIASPWIQKGLAKACATFSRQYISTLLFGCMIGHSVPATA